MDVSYRSLRVFYHRLRARAIAKIQLQDVQSWVRVPVRGFLTPPILCDINLPKRMIQVPIFFSEEVMHVGNALLDA